MMRLLQVFLALFGRAPATPPEPVSDNVVPAPSVPTEPAATVPPAQTWLSLCRPLVRFYEKCVLVAYWDALGKVWTCGWGSTGPDVRSGTVWTQAQADERNDTDINLAAGHVDAAVKVALSPQQKGALVSLIYNVGPGRADKGAIAGRDGIITLRNGQPSTLLRKLNSGDYSGAADEFLVWNKAGGVVVNGLSKRRAAERQLFLTGVWR